MVTYDFNGNGINIGNTVIFASMQSCLHKATILDLKKDTICKLKPIEKPDCLVYRKGKQLIKEF